MEGSIKYCYDRNYPTVKQEYCKELAENAEDSFKYWGPCSGHSVHTCSPLYITVWGKERTTPCKGKPPFPVLSIVTNHDRNFFRTQMSSANRLTRSSSPSATPDCTAIRRRDWLPPLYFKWSAWCLSGCITLRLYKCNLHRIV